VCQLVQQTSFPMEDGWRITSGHLTRSEPTVMMLPFGKSYVFGPSRYQSQVRCSKVLYSTCLAIPLLRWQQNRPLLNMHIYIPIYTQNLKSKKVRVTHVAVKSAHYINHSPARKATPCLPGHNGRGRQREPTPVNRQPPRAGATGLPGERHNQIVSKEG
jgi:hypothetical protein